MKKTDEKNFLAQLNTEIATGLTRGDLEDFERMKTVCLLNILVKELTKKKILSENNLKIMLNQELKRMYNLSMKAEEILKKLDKKVSYIG
jgi:hypothetical protein